MDIDRMRRLLAKASHLRRVLPERQRPFDDGERMAERRAEIEEAFKKLDAGRARTESKVNKLANKVDMLAGKIDNLTGEA